MARFVLASGALLALLGLAGCASDAPQGPGARIPLEEAGRRFVVLSFQLARHDPDFVDSYYGPPEWKAAAEHDSLPLDVIAARADSVAATLGADPGIGGDPNEARRHRFLHGQFRALAARARIVAGDTLSFDDEARALYGVTPPGVDDAVLDTHLANIESLLPGAGTLAERYERFRATLRIPPDRVDTVFRAALAEARARTMRHIALPDSESFTIEYVRDQPWSGYNWYQGGYRSLIQVNLDNPIHIDRALDLACHEGYPGHHVLGVLIEQHQVRGRGWREMSLMPLYSPLGLIAEGSANVGPEVAFSAEERRAFEKRVLFPLAGLDTSGYERYQQVRAAVESLGTAGIGTARDYLGGRITREQAIERAMRYQLQERDRAERTVRFWERYRSYTVNYGLGKRMVRAWLERNGGTDANPARRWELFEQLLREPHVTADLEGPAT